jgi:hypothetical protein
MYIVRYAERVADGQIRYYGHISENLDSGIQTEFGGIISRFSHGSHDRDSYLTFRDYWVSILNMYR